MICEPVCLHQTCKLDTKLEEKYTRRTQDKEHDSPFFKLLNEGVKCL